jgi:hypothetical protein
MKKKGYKSKTTFEKQNRVSSGFAQVIFCGCDLKKINFKKVQLAVISWI